MRRPEARIARAARELARLARSGGDGPDRGAVAVFLCVEGDADKGDARAVGRNLRVADPNQVEEILFSDVAFLRKGRRGQKDEDDQQERDTKRNERRRRISESFR